MKNGANVVHLQLRVPPELNQALKALARRNHRSVHGEMMYAIEKHLKEERCGEEDTENRPRNP